MCDTHAAPVAPLSPGPPHCPRAVGGALAVGFSPSPPVPPRTPHPCAMECSCPASKQGPAPAPHASPPQSGFPIFRAQARRHTHPRAHAPTWCGCCCCCEAWLGADLIISSSICFACEAPRSLECGGGRGEAGGRGGKRKQAGRGGRLSRARVGCPARTSCAGRALRELPEGQEGAPFLG